MTYLLFIISNILFYFLGRFSREVKTFPQKSSIQEIFKGREPITFHNPQKQAETKAMLKDIPDAK
jgi:hypothetical protein